MFLQFKEGTTFVGPNAPSLFDQASHWLFSSITTRRRPRNLPQAKKKNSGKRTEEAKVPRGNFDLELCDVSHDEAMRGSGIFGAHRGLTIRICRQSATGFVSPHREQLWDQDRRGCEKENL